MKAPAPVSVVTDLGRMAARIDQLLAGSPGQQSAEELYRVHSDIAYLWNYAEGNRRHFDDASIDTLARGVLDSATLAERAATWLADVTASGDAADEMRRRWIAWFDRCGARVGLEDEDRRFAGAVGRLLEDVRSDRLALLDRLGAPRGPDPEVAYFRLAAGAERCDLRTRLATAWARPWQHRVPQLHACIDARVERRRAQARRSGWSSVWAQTFRDSAVASDEVRSFLVAFVARARVAHARLGAEIAKAVGCETRPLDHFGRFLRHRAGHGPPPLLPIDACLTLLASLARAAFDVSLERRESCENAIRYAVYDEHGLRGVIVFDLLDTEEMRGTSPLAADTAVPTGRVLCRLHRGTGDRVMAFDAVHGLFHEFGHALDHVLFGDFHPSSTGLDLLPLERLEDLSGWFEKWVFHPDLAEALHLGGFAAERLRAGQRIKKLESLRSLFDLAVMAHVDFQLHADDRGTAQHALDTALADLDLQADFDAVRPLADFAHPLLRACPGATFVFLWGACAGASAFAPFAGAPIADACAPGRGAFAVSDGGRGIRAPAVDALFDLYETAS